MKKVLGRILIVLPAIALQTGWYCVMFGLLRNLFYGHFWTVINGVLSILAVIFVVGLVSKRMDSSYKLLWAILMVSMPILGVLLYFMLGNKATGRKLQKKLNASVSGLPELIRQEHQENLSKVQQEDLRFGQILSQVSQATGFPLFKNSTGKYYALGEEMFRDMCSDLRCAKKYIYVEYFIIQSGLFWDSLTDIMAEKVRECVDVRVIYDDLGSIGTFSVTDVKALTRKGIKCIPFNPFLFIKSQLNNRDHRKFMVIDGQIAYSGGVNLADEYINETHPYGHWKDIGFRITGEGVSAYSHMFVEFWNAFSPNKIPTETGISPEAIPADRSCGYLLPYYDSPTGDEHVSNALYIEILSATTDYVWFYTPYLLPGDTLTDAFIRAARRGVDVRIMMPGVSDNRVVHRISRSYYRELLQAGVKIYEYTPGFLHAKALIADDKIASIGTTNLDYRSLFLHFECNALFYKTDILQDLRQDYLTTLESCVTITPDSLKDGLLHNLGDSFLRIIAPLL